MSIIDYISSSTAAATPSHWWEQIRAGNQEGLKSLYSHYMQDMFRYGMAIYDHNSLVKDCIQEVFVSLWKYRKSLKSDINIKGYLLKSLSNKLHKEIAKETQRYHSNSCDQYENLLFTDSEEKKLIDRQTLSSQQKHLAEALCKLPERQKEVIQLIFFENNSYEATSEIMGINLRSAYTLAWKAISSLKKSVLLISSLIMQQLLS